MNDMAVPAFQSDRENDCNVAFFRIVRVEVRISKSFPVGAVPEQLPRLHTRQRPSAKSQAFQRAGMRNVVATDSYSAVLHNYFTQN